MVGNLKNVEGGGARTQPERVKGLNNTVFTSVDKEKQSCRAVIDHLNPFGDKERQVPVIKQFADGMGDGDSGGPIMENSICEHRAPEPRGPVTEVTRITFFFRFHIRAPSTLSTWITFDDRASLEKAKPVVGKYVAYAIRETPLLRTRSARTVDLEKVEETKITVIGWKTAEVNWALSDRSQDLLLMGLMEPEFQDQETTRNSDEVKEIIKEMGQVGEFDSERTMSLDFTLEEAA
ncbi:hypothetical protein H4582DRAFT_2054227 [Lactarius indigo]|nr:hypothetical protein H4582DRAFT_2054227 [Lactarius indigo]